MRRLSSVLLCVGLLALLAVPATALSQGSVQSGWASSAPNLNGKLGPGEWADATRVRLHAGELNGATALGGKPGDLILGEEVSTQQVTGWARFMNDARYLYLATTLDVGAPAGDPDYFITESAFFFEDEPVIGDGRWAADLCSQNPSEGAYVSYAVHYPGPGGDFDYDWFVPGSEEHTCGEQFNPPGYREGRGWNPITFEARIDLQTSELDVAPGDCFNAGVLIASAQSYLDHDPADYGGMAEWPAGLTPDDGESDWPDAFGEVCLAAPEEFVPEPGTIALLGTGLASLGGYATLRWRLRRKE